MWDNVFRTGKWKDAGGREVEVTEADLDHIVASYDPAQREAPLVFGHPKTNAPAFGWVEGVRRVGEFLQAKYRQVPEAVKEIVAKGHYRHKSISLNPDKTLRHVGILGAVPPAVEGLGAVQFAGPEDGVMEFQEGVPAQAATVDAEGTESGGNDPAETGEEDEEMDPKAELERLKSESDELKKKLAQAEGERDQARAEFSQREQEALKEAREKKADELIAAGKMFPKDKERVLAFAAQLGAGTEELCFSQSEGKKPLEDHFWAFMAERDAHGLFREFSAPADDAGQAGTGEMFESLTQYA